MPTRSEEARHAVTRTTESPLRTTTEPPACFASLPVSSLIVLSPIETSLVVIDSTLQQVQGANGASGANGSNGSRSSRDSPGVSSLLHPLNPLNLLNLSTSGCSIS